MCCGKFLSREPTLNDGWRVHATSSYDGCFVARIVSKTQRDSDVGRRPRRSYLVEACSLNVEYLEIVRPEFGIVVSSQCLGDKLHETGV